MQLPIIRFLFFLGIFHFCISKIDMDSKYFANSTEMRKKAKEYDKECMRIYRNSKRQEEMICDHMEANIKSLEHDDKYYLSMPHKGFEMPKPYEETLKFGENDAYRAVFERYDKNIVCDGKEALMSLYFGNAVYLSSWTNKIIRLYPIGSNEELSFEEEFIKYFNKKI